MNDFLSMGGYATYVWSSYLLAAVVLVWNIIAAIAAHREAKEKALRNLSMAGVNGARASQ